MWELKTNCRGSDCVHITTEISSCHYTSTCGIYAIVDQIEDKLHKIAQHADDINVCARHSVEFVACCCASMRIFRVAITFELLLNAS